MWGRIGYALDQTMVFFVSNCVIPILTRIKDDFNKERVHAETQGAEDGWSNSDAKWKSARTSAAFLSASTQRD
jgi:hypothetical protein